MTLLSSGSGDELALPKCPKDGVYVNSDGHRAEFRKDAPMPADYLPDTGEEPTGKQVRNRETGTQRRKAETAD